ncbi:MAG: antibiotic biosynthesis monooxygenase [Saprospiraceae bacterium]|nr:antibiotic biosynthesis monooxygenase [Saprospiraceae bacterium]
MEIIRVVRLAFQEEKISDFAKIFEESSINIRSFEGCIHLELMRDHFHANVFYTYSRWASNEALNAYRNSSLFKNTWKETKKLFTDKPQAFSMISLQKVQVYILFINVLFSCHNIL